MSFIEIPRADNQQAPVFFIPNDASLPAVIVVQEWWGVNEHIKKVAQQFADQGYSVLIPDLYRGKVATTQDEAGHLFHNLDFGSAVEDVRAAVEFLKQRSNGKVGLVGFCMGGAIALLTATKVPTLAASVCYYGIPPAFAAKDLAVPIQCHFATHDDWVTPQKVSELTAALAEAGTSVPHEIYSYDAHHAFFNDSRPEVYSEEAKKLSLQRTLAFYKTHLQ